MFSQLTFILLVLPVFVLSDYTTTPTAKENYGTWQGWGTSLAWWATAWGERTDLSDAFFTLKTSVTINNTFTVPGLGLTIARYNAGATSEKVAAGQYMERSPNVKDSRLVEAFWLTYEGNATTQWDWSRDLHQRTALTNAVDRGVDIVQLFSNSPVWWMCDNHNPSGSEGGSTDNLQTWNQRNHTKYLASIIAYFQEHNNVTFDSVDAFNEPNSNWWKASGTQEGCHFSPQDQAILIQYMREELDALHLNHVKIAASDENSYTLAIATWNSFDATTKNVVDQVNVHGYEYGNGRRDVLYNITKGTTLWNSEYAEGDASGMSLATNLNLDFYYLHPTAWVYWQAVDGLSWGLLKGNEDTVPPVLSTSPNNKYFVVAQYTRHIRPGMTIINGGTDKNTVAAWDADAKKLVLVTTNYKTAQTVTYDVSKIYSGSKGSVCPTVAKCWTTNGNGSKQYVQEKDVSVTSGKGTCVVAVMMEVNQVMTLEMDGGVE
jgi:galactan endo-1,6-beta-galactosidase